MATDDRGPAERVRRVLAGEDKHAVYGGDKWNTVAERGYFRDLEAVARARLAPPDVLAAAGRVADHHFHEDEPSPLTPEAGGCVRDDCLTLARWVRGAGEKAPEGRG